MLQKKKINSREPESAPGSGKNMVMWDLAEPGGMGPWRAQDSCDTLSMGKSLGLRTP